MYDVAGKIRVIVSICTAYIVILLVSGFRQFAEGRQDRIVSAAALVGLSHVVVDRFPPVQTDDHIAHFFIGKLDDLVVEQHAVGGQREPEILVTFFFSAAPIGNQFFHNVEVEQRFAAEEIHFQIAPGAGVFDEPVQRTLAGLVAHKSLFSVVFSLSCKAVAAGHIAGMGYVETDGFYDRLTFLEQFRLPCKEVAGEQLMLVF